MRNPGKLFTALACSLALTTAIANEQTSAQTGFLELSELSLHRTAFFPADQSLARPEDGVFLPDGTLLVASQIHGLISLSPNGEQRPFGDFSAAGFVHNPPSHAAGPNGVAIEPDGDHVLVADIFSGAIYRVALETEHVTLAYQHQYGTNAARRDSSGALWFTQSAKNSGPDSEGQMFASAEMRLTDGALYRLPPGGESSQVSAELKVSDLIFANGLAIDEERGALYLAETIANRIIAYRLNVATGDLSDRRVVAEVMTPDNIELDAMGRLWVASPIANALVVVNPQSGEVFTAFQESASKSARVTKEWNRRLSSGESLLELMGPDAWSPLPGLITGMILTKEGGPVYLTGLGDKLVRLEYLAPE